MGKSIRSKTKRTHRRAKRESGVFAAQNAARLQRLSVKLASCRDAEPEAAEVEEDEGAEPMVVVPDMASAGEDTPAKQKISTHGPRNSGRELWRKSKGLDPRPKKGAVNKQGVVASTKRPGRSKRRR